MTPSMCCRMIARPSRRQTIKREFKKIQKMHPPYEWALEGTLENIEQVNNFLKEKDMQGYLFGGCINQELPRKDIDVFLKYWLGPGDKEGYKTLGVDWWFLEDYQQPPTGKNVNGIITELPCCLGGYRKKEIGGLLLPEDHISTHQGSELVKLLYN